MRMVTHVHLEVMAESTVRLSTGSLARAGGVLATLALLASPSLSADPRRSLTVTIPAGHAESLDAVRRAFRDGGWVLMRERPDTLLAMPYRLDDYPYIELAFKAVLRSSDSSTQVTLSGKLTDLRIWRVKAIEEKSGSNEMAFAWAELSRLWAAVKAAHPDAT